MRAAVTGFEFVYDRSRYSTRVDGDFRDLFLWLRCKYLLITGTKTECSTTYFKYILIILVTLMYKVILFYFETNVIII